MSKLKTIASIIIFYTIIFYSYNAYPASYSLEDLFNKQQTDKILYNYKKHFKFKKSKTGYYDFSTDSLRFIDNKYYDLKNYFKDIISSDSSVNESETFKKFQEYLVLGGFIRLLCDDKSYCSETIFCLDAPAIFFNYKKESSLVNTFKILNKIGLITGSMTEFLERANNFIEYEDGILNK